MKHYLFFLYGLAMAIVSCDLFSEEKVVSVAVFDAGEVEASVWWNGDSLDLPEPFKNELTVALEYLDEDVTLVTNIFNPQTSMAQFKGLRSGEYELVFRFSGQKYKYTFNVSKDSSYFNSAIYLSSHFTVEFPVSSEMESSSSMETSSTQNLSSSVLDMSSAQDVLSSSVMMSSLEIMSSSEQISSSSYDSLLSSSFTVSSSSDSLLLSSSEVLSSDNILISSSSSIEESSSSEEPSIDWFENVKEVHLIPGKVEAEYFIDPDIAEDSSWAFYESTPNEIETAGTFGPSDCRTDVQLEFGVDITGNGNFDPGASTTPDNYTGVECAADAEITYIRYGERLSYALVVEKPTTFRVKARVASGHNASDTYSTPPYAFNLQFYNPGDEFLVEKVLTYYVLDTGSWQKYETFLPQEWIEKTEYNDGCNKPIAGYEALMTSDSDCWLSSLPEDVVTLPAGQWIMEFISQEGAYVLNYFEFEEVQ